MQSDSGQVPAEGDSSPDYHNRPNSYNQSFAWAAQLNPIDAYGSLEGPPEGAAELGQAPFPDDFTQTFPYYSQLAMDGPSYHDSNGREPTCDAVSLYDASSLYLANQFDASIMTGLEINNPYTQIGHPNTRNPGHQPHDLTPLSTLNQFNVPLHMAEGASITWPMTQTPFYPQPIFQGQEHWTIDPGAFNALTDHQLGDLLLENDATAPPTFAGTVPGSGVLMGASVSDINHAAPSRSRNRIDWKFWGNTVRDLYLSENHTAEEVCFEMSAIYGTQIGLELRLTTYRSLSTLHHRFKKNKVDNPEQPQESEEADRLDEADGPDEVQRPGEPNTTKKTKKDRLRAAKSLPKTKSDPSAFVFHANRRLIAELRKVPGPPPPQAREPFVCQHAMLHALDRLVKGIFGSGQPSPAELIGVDGGSLPWQLVYHKCEGLVRVISGQAPLGGKIRFLLLELLGQLDDTVSERPRDLGFLLHLWNICLCLSDVRFPRCSRDNRSIFLRIFLYRLRNSLLSRTRNPRDDLVVLVECLMRVMTSESPYNLRATLGMGCGKVMDMVGEMVGHNHAAVLNLGSSCARYWKRNFSVNRDRSEAQYKPLVDGIINTGSPGEVEIAALYAYTVAQWDSKSQTTALYAAHLWSLTVAPSQQRACCGSLRYDQLTRAFAFSSELLVVCHLDPVIAQASHRSGLDRAGFSDALQRVAEAIEVLRLGDLDCIVGAANLSKRLSLWYKSYHKDNPDPNNPNRYKPNSGQTKKRHPGRSKGKAFEDEKARTSQLMSQIGELPLPYEFHDPERKKKTGRWRRRRLAKSQAVAASVAAEGGMQKATTAQSALVYAGPPARQTTIRPNKKAADSETVSVEPSSIAPWERRTCWHCGHTFPSGNARRRHVESGCSERHVWSEL